jgi:hypothetical protein
MQTQMAFMDDDDNRQGEDDDALRVAELAPHDSVLSMIKIGIPVAFQHSLLLWVIPAKDLKATRGFSETDVRRCFHNLLMKTMGTMTLDELRK